MPVQSPNGKMKIGDETSVGAGESVAVIMVDRNDGK